MKIEFDVPYFEKELSINIILRKDGEVVATTSPSAFNSGKEYKETKLPDIVVDDKKVSSNMSNKKETLTSSPTVDSPVKRTPTNGNFMDGNFMDPSLF